jgi:ComF family protein
VDFSLLDLIFPKRCVNCGRFGTYICRDCAKLIEYVDKPVCPYCERQAIGGKAHPGCLKKYGLDGLIVVCRYRGPIKGAIVKIKYKWVFDIEKILVTILASNLWKFDFPTEAVLVPVPLHARRKRWRGFNQAEILGRDLARRFKHPYADLLLRNRYTRPQVELKKDKRRENVRGAFALRLATLAQGRIISSVEGKNIILVDDVYTTGATMSECAKVLKRAGAKSVWAMAVALG